MLSARCPQCGRPGPLALERPDVLQCPACGYDGPLSVEWEDSGMDREHGAAEACAFVRDLDFPTSETAFDAAFSE